MGIRVQSSDLTTPTLHPPPKETQWQITVISCKDLPDTDGAGIGFGNKSDPYVTVRVGKDGEKQQTKAISGKLDPVFKKETSVFEFDVSPTAKMIFFEVMDKDVHQRRPHWQGPDQADRRAGQRDLALSRPQGQGRG